MDFGAILRKRRIQSKLSQKDLSSRIGVTKQTLSGWETRRYFPSQNLLKKISSLLHIPLAEILKVKKQLKAQRQKELILHSKDPVVSAVGPAFVPLLDKKTKTLPLEAIKNPSLWNERRCFLPENLFPGFIFGFEIGDKYMEPDYPPGEIMLIDMREKPRDGQAVVVCVKGHPPVCRVYSSEGKMRIFNSIGLKGPAVRVQESNIAWCYPVLRRLADPY